ncbi:probable prefoldin subunit 2 [Thrips palmi]|uniref:Probable prefoldin subunit 2 n=1 Tax=Thrips palmi TaxID=161013 RepID=A0A6P9A6T9_THRPL|nr:probable prefoldin subunit 2 [Thrips palmi]
MAADGESKPKTSKGKTPTQEEIYNGFQTLRNEQRVLVTKLSELELDLSEHKIVVDTMKDLDGDRKCFQLIGGVLCERTVKEVLPQLTLKRDSITKVITDYNEQITKKGKDINEYKEKYNIKVRGQDDMPSETDSKDKGESSSPSKNVMVEAM